MAVIGGKRPGQPVIPGDARNLQRRGQAIPPGTQNQPTTTEDREERLELFGYPENIVELLEEWWEHRDAGDWDAYAEEYSSVLNGYYRHGLMAETTYRFLRDGIWKHIG